MTIEEYQAATSIPAVRGESEPSGRDLSAGELRTLFEACSRPSTEGRRQDSAVRRRREAAFLALAYSWASAAPRRSPSTSPTWTWWPWCWCEAAAGRRRRLVQLIWFIPEPRGGRSTSEPESRAVSEA
jgi:hypothetical protein